MGFTSLALSVSASWRLKGKGDQMLNRGSAPEVTVTLAIRERKKTYGMPGAIQMPPAI